MRKLRELSVWLLGPLMAIPYLLGGCQSLPPPADPHPGTGEVPGYYYRPVLIEPSPLDAVGIGIDMPEPRWLGMTLSDAYEVGVRPNNDGTFTVIAREVAPWIN